MKFDNKQIIPPSPMNASVTSSPMDLTSCPYASLQFIVTGAAAPTGTAQIQFSDDPNAPLPAGSLSPNTLWGTDSTVNAPTLTANGNTLVNIPSTGHRWMRVVYTTGTGNGTLTVNAMSKGPT